GRTPSQNPVLVQDDHSQRQSRQHRLHAEKGINSSVIQYRAHQRIGLRDPPVVELNPCKHPIEKGESEDCRRDKPGSKVVDIHVSNPIVSPPARFSAPAEPREQSRFPLATITTCAVFHRIPLSSCHHDTKPYRSLVPRTSDLSGASAASGNFFDTANVYNNSLSESILGKALKGRRHNVVVATKVRGKMGEEPDDAGLSRPAIRKAIDASLKRLQTDYVDLYYLHQPDWNTPI